MDGSIKSTGSYTDTYIYGVNNAPLELLRQRGTRTDRYWYALDGRGNVVALTDSSGAVVDRYAYDPWGEGLPEGTSETVAQPFRYAGYWWDKELGWYWVGVRSYDPEGRWLQPDPSEQDGLRTYAYVCDDPIDASDPTGLFIDFCRIGLSFFCHSQQSSFQNPVYMLLIGDDLSTLGEPNGNFALKGLALVDLASNVALVFPVVGEAARFEVKVAAAGAIRLASGTGGRAGRMVIVREINRGERVGDLLNELKQLTFTGGKEHAIVKLSNGKRVIVSGAHKAIQLSEDVNYLYVHTHPYDVNALGPSGADYNALKALGQASSYLLEHGSLSKFRR